MNTLFRIRTIAQYSLYEGWRGYIFLTATALIIICSAISEFGGMLVLADGWQTKVSLYAFTIRLSLVAVITIYITSAVLRERIDKQTEWLLSIDHPRHNYLYGKITGFLTIGLLLTVLAGIYPFIYSNFVDTLLWLISFYAEISVIILLSVFVAISLNNSVGGFVAVAGFYILARNIGNFILIAQSPVIHGGNNSADIAGYLIEAVHYLLPDFWRYADTSWLLYSSGGVAELGSVLAEALIFCLLLLFAASIDLYRKNL